eukprot:GHVT01067817.1.p2 GENE.GHVT01067817.1~~GHVT01067817.1.p2  ORF type:complete len:191 (-),score=9.43 GHVT01067817.1:344-916(-)
MFVQDDCRLLECLARLPSLSNFGAQLLEDILEDMPKNISALQSDRHLRDNARRGVISAHLLARILSALHAIGAYDVDVFAAAGKALYRDEGTVRRTSLEVLELLHSTFSTFKTKWKHPTLNMVSLFPGNVAKSPQGIGALQSSDEAISTEVDLVIKRLAEDIYPRVPHSNSNVFRRHTLKYKVYLKDRKG